MKTEVFRPGISAALSTKVLMIKMPFVRRKERKKMTTLKVKEMSCNHCVERIGKALEAAGIKHSIDLAAKTVVIDGCENGDFGAG